MATMVGTMMANMMRVAFDQDDVLGAVDGTLRIETTPPGAARQRQDRADRSQDKQWAADASEV